MAENKDEIITAQSQIDEFTTRLRNYINGQTQWWNGNYPNTTGFPSGWLGARDPGGPSAGNLGDVITAGTIVSVFGNWMEQYGLVRRFRFVRTGNIYGTYDATARTNLYGNTSRKYAGGLSNTISDAASRSIAQDAVINATNFNNFLTDLKSWWDNGPRISTTTYSVNFCHNSCHQSCYGNHRWRR